MKNTRPSIALSLMILVSTAASLSGCLRGETKSLDQIVAAAQQEFASIDKEGLATDTANTLVRLNDELSKLAQGTTTTSDVITAAENDLTALLPLAGYPVRPSFTEVRNEFLEASDMAAVNPAQAKHLAFRAYTILSAELSQGRFQINKSS